MLRETDGGTWLLAREGDNGYSLYTRVAQQQQPAVPIFGAAAPAAMQIDPAGAGSPGAAAFGSPATHGTPAAGPQQPSSLFGSSRPLPPTGWPTPRQVRLSGSSPAPSSDGAAGGWLAARLCLRSEPEQGERGPVGLPLETAPAWHPPQLTG
eukprot:4697240-Prymnesium_polylepis.1